LSAELTKTHSFRLFFFAHWVEAAQDLKNKNQQGQYDSKKLISYLFIIPVFFFFL